ncbi:MAG TPA: hypothetical protein VM328_10655 [Fimbriimonadaceae bacterium]|nr:hypothetical protein [Fimbriimonadaceae bacterium]
MTYFVVLPNGQRFGPADLMTLQQWVHEGRVHPHYLIQDSITGARVEARLLPGLMFPGSSPSWGGYASADDGSGDIRNAYLFSVLGFLCCGLISFVGIVFAIKAREKGHPQANLALAVAIISFFANVALSAMIQRAMNPLQGLR